MKGLTLAETIVGVLIFTLLAGCLYGILTTGLKVYNRDTARLDMEQTARTAMERIVKDLRASRAHTVTTLSAGSEKISFDTSIYSGIKFYITGSQLMREFPAGTVNPLAADITGLTFSPHTGNALTITLTAQRNLYNTPVSFTFIERVRLRNE